MDGERDPGKISQAYQDHLPYLVDLAFRMVGDIGTAEDIAQDAFSRLIRADLGEIEDERGSSSSRRLPSPRWPIPPIGSPSTMGSGSPCWSCCSGSARPSASSSSCTTFSGCPSAPSPKPARPATWLACSPCSPRRYGGTGATLVSHPVGGQPAVLGFTGRELAGVLVFTMHGEVIQAVHVIGDPRKLSFLSSQLSASA
jgi:hypothetical protein